MVDVFKSLYGVDRQEMIDAKKAQIQNNSPFTPEHSGVSDDGRALSATEVMSGGARVATKADLDAQREGFDGEIPLMAVDRPMVEMRREAARQLAEENQQQAEDTEKARAKEAAKADRQANADEKAAKPVKIVEDKTADDKPAI